MILHDLIASLVRRWYFVVAGLLATAALGLLVHGVVPVTYRASASVVLVPPPTAVISGDNPYLYMGGLDQALSVLSVKLNSDAVAGPIAEENGDATYVVARDLTTSGPIMQVDVDGADPGSTLSALNAVLDAIPGTLASLQEELAVESGSRISVLELAIDQESTVVDRTQTRAVVTAVAAGVASTLLLSGLFDRVLLERRAGKRRLRDPRSVSRAGSTVRGSIPVAGTDSSASSPTMFGDEQADPSTRGVTQGAHSGRYP